MKRGNNKYCLFIILFLLVLNIYLTSAIKISPTQQGLIIAPSEEGCTNIWVLPEKDLEISSKWTIDGKGNITRYVLEPENIGMEIEYKYVANGKYDFCFTPKKGGNFSGIIYFYSEKEMIEIGTWVEIMAPTTDFQEKITILSGNIVREIQTSSSELKNGALGGILIILVGLLLTVAFSRKGSLSIFNQKSQKSKTT